MGFIISISCCNGLGREIEFVVALMMVKQTLFFEDIQIRPRVRRHTRAAACGLRQFHELPVTDFTYFKIYNLYILI
jgi:hypothetical protein